MSRIVAISIALLIAVLVGFGVYQFYQTHEYKEKTIHTGFLGEARKNQFYASRLFLKRMGIDTQTRESIQDVLTLPSTDTVLVITTRRTTLSPRRTDEIIDWVKSGGHLIGLATRDWIYSGSLKDEDEDFEEDELSPDPLQRFMGVRTRSRISSDESSDEVESIIDEFLDEEDSKTIHQIKLVGLDKALSLNSPSYRPIVVSQERRSKTEEVPLFAGNFLVRQKIGEGMVTLVSDLDFIQNDEIEEHDHAEIFWQLIHGLHKPIDQPTRVWLIHNDEMPSLWALIWQYSWAFILSLGLLFIAWMMKSTRRFGPMIPKQEEDRRSLMEHISSSGNFYWKHNKKQKLVESSRGALMHRLSQIHPGWAQRTEEERVKILAEQVSMEPKAVHRLLHEPDIEQADEFTQLIRQLDKIRKQI